MKLAVTIIALVISRACLASEDCLQQAKLEAVNIARGFLEDDFTHEHSIGENGFTITIGKPSASNKQNVPKGAVASYWVPISLGPTSKPVITMQQLLIFGPNCIRDQRAELGIAALSKKRAK